MPIPELDGAVVVEFPLRGEWVAFNSPADRIPSHGTDLLGQRFAFDLIRTDRRKGWRIHPAGGWRSNLLGFPVRETYAWGQPVHMPFDGEIVAAEDGWPERSRIVPIREIAVAVKNGVTFRPDRLRSLLGNYVIARGADVFAGFAHLVPGSVSVAAGASVRSGALIGRVGHSGNSTAPHLHFQLMDSPDLLTAGGVPCAFRRLEVERDGAWIPMHGAIPGRADRVRYPE
jgi:murein DD-endopeptidase MepM/ murein hydrolase activator NlpD